jgi:UrcA family protein
MAFFRVTACAVAFVVGTVATAAPRVRVVSSTEDQLVQATEVRLSDLDLRSPQGERQLEARLREAADAVCRTPRSEGEVDPWSGRACIKEALADARARVSRRPEHKAVAFRSAKSAAAPDQPGL